ncbi:carbohydrate ABC transporter permease [Clostridiales bacterium COT073_COT-073]|nr:carbohydrate ABC transporter permease [Clostridiales bacterium COT073_COT-073]
MTKLKNAMRYLVLLIAAFFSLFPLYWMIVSATNTSTDVIRGKLTFGTNLFQNYQDLIAVQNLKMAMINSARNAILLTLLSVLVCSIAGYGFEVYHDKYKDMVMKILLLTMMVPFAAVMIPLFRQFGNLKLINTTIGFMLPSIATPFLIMLFRQSTRSFPRDIIEAARIDGLSELGIFLRMFVPTMKSTYAAAITVVFMAAWNSYLWPKIIMLDPDKFTMPMLVSNLIAGYVTNYGVLMLAVTICTLPTGILFLILQESFAEGITGSVKG